MHGASWKTVRIRIYSLYIVLTISLIAVGSSRLNSLIGQTSKSSGGPVSNIWSPRKRSPKVLGIKNDLIEGQLPTLDAFKIVPYPALDSQLLQIIFSPKTLLDKMAKDVREFDMTKKKTDSDIEISSALGLLPDAIAQDVNIVESPKIVAAEFTVGEPSETLTKYDEIIKIVDAKPTDENFEQNIESPKTILIEEVKSNPNHNEDAQIIMEPKILSELDDAVSIPNSPIGDVDDEIASDFQSPTEFTNHTDDLEYSVIEGNPSNLLINESSEIMQKVAEIPDESVAIDDCDECNDCDKTASEIGDLEMASNEVSSIRSENDSPIDPIFEEETVAEVVPTPRRARVPQALPAVIIAEPIVSEKQDATENYVENITQSAHEEPKSESADEKQIDLDVHEKFIEKLEIPKTASILEDKIDQELNESSTKTSVPIISSAEEKEIEQELDELSIEDTELPRISDAEEKAIEKKIDETLAPKILTEPAALAIVAPTLFSKNVKRQIGNDIMRPDTMNKPMFMNNLENETSSEKRERIQKTLQRMMHFVTIVGHVDSYLTKRFRSGVRTFARLCESGEDMRLRHRRSKFSF